MVCIAHVARIANNPNVVKNKMKLFTLPMGQDKYAFGLRIDRSLYAQIQAQAEKEERTPSNLGEVLLKLSMRQLRISDSKSVELLHRNMIEMQNPSLGKGLPAPPEIETQLKIEDDLRRKHGPPGNPDRKRKNN